VIFDGKDKFPNSCIEYVRFRHYPLRERFAKLREQEKCLQDAIERIVKEFPDEFFKLKNKIQDPQVYCWIRSIFFLEFVEGELCWMAHNIPEDHKDEEPQLPRQRRRRSKKQVDPRISKQIPIWDLMNVEAF
jgi:hypothetical protein